MFAQHFQAISGSVTSTLIALESSRQSLRVLVILILCGREIGWDHSIICMLLTICHFLQPRGEHPGQPFPIGESVYLGFMYVVRKLDNETQCIWVWILYPRLWNVILKIYALHCYKLWKWIVRIALQSKRGSLNHSWLTINDSDRQICCQKAPMGDLIWSLTFIWTLILWLVI